VKVQQLQNQVGTDLRLRPIADRVSRDGECLPKSDDPWRLEAILNDPVRVRLVNQVSGHSVELQSDNVREYRSPGFLLLRCQLTVLGENVHLEPIHSFDETFGRLEHQMPELLDEMRRDVAESPLKREIVLLKRSWLYWAKGTELAYYFEDHPDLLSKFQVLENNSLVMDITYNNIYRYQMSEELAAYLGAHWGKGS